MPNSRVILWIKAEPSGMKAEENLLLWMWRDREDMADVEAYVSKLRGPHF